MRVPYRHLRTSQEWHDWDSSHKQFDPSTRTWDLFPEPIPHTVLHYSHLLSANSPNHPPPSLPIAPGDVSPHESTWDHYGSSLPVMFIKDYDLPTTYPLCPLHQWTLTKTKSLFKMRTRTHILPQRVILSSHHQLLLLLLHTRSGSTLATTTSDKKFPVWTAVALWMLRLPTGSATIGTFLIIFMNNLGSL